MSKAESGLTIEAIENAWCCVPLEFLGVDSRVDADEDVSRRSFLNTIMRSLKDTTERDDWLRGLRKKSKTKGEALLDKFVHGLVRWALRIQTDEYCDHEVVANMVIMDSRYWALYHGVGVKLPEHPTMDNYQKKLTLAACESAFSSTTIEGVFLKGVLKAEPTLNNGIQDHIQTLIRFALEPTYSMRQLKPKTQKFLEKSKDSVREVQQSVKSKRRAGIDQRAVNDAEGSMLGRPSTTPSDQKESLKRKSAKPEGGKKKKQKSEENPSGDTVESSYRKNSSGSKSISSQRNGKRKIPIAPDVDGNAINVDATVVPTQTIQEKKMGKKSKRKRTQDQDIGLDTNMEGQDGRTNATERPPRDKAGSRNAKTKRKREPGPAKLKSSRGQQHTDVHLRASSSKTSSNEGSDTASVGSSVTLVGSGLCPEKVSTKGFIQDAVTAEGASKHDLPPSVLSTTRPQSGRVVYLDNQDDWRRVLASSQPTSGSAQTVKRQLPEGVRPHIWASSRQAVCETTSFFRSYHGGVYQRQGEVEGYLLGGFSSERDQCAHDGRLIISHGGGSGGRTLDETSGQAEDDKTVRALKNAFQQKKPIVLLADDQYALFPYQFAPRWVYVVLGFYTIVDAWEERDVDQIDGLLCGRTKYKFAFQYCDREDPWWAPATSTEQQDPHDPFQSHSKVCSECEKESPTIYEQRWLCLNSKCRKFFDVQPEEYRSLKMSESFLALRNIEKRVCQYRYQFEDKEGEPKLRYTARGRCCTRCGQMCPREHWEKWWCSSCEQPIPMADNSELPIIRPLEFSHSQPQTSKSYKTYNNSGIIITEKAWHEPGAGGRPGGFHLQFCFPEERGTVHLIQSQFHTIKKANELFAAYQKEARDRPFLRRYPLQSHQARGQFLSNYFSHNAGVPYKYIVSTNATVPFDQAPQCVNDALSLIKERASLVLEKPVDFNEILTAAYMERQSMSYHTDDEKGLGPTVASLSLGTAAHMHFRPRKRAFREQQEKAAAQAHEGEDVAKPDEAVESKHRDRVNADRHLSLVLRHGDILIMDGAKIQELYEHTVEPCNFRIAATARMIDANIF